MRVAATPGAERLGYGLKVVGRLRNPERFNTAADGQIAWGGNSGYQALGLAVQFGCRRVVLVGFDMRLDLGCHWHGPHKGNLGNPSENKVSKWRQRLDAAAPVLREHGVRVINASSVSALQAYPKMPLQEAIDELLRA